MLKTPYAFANSSDFVFEDIKIVKKLEKNINNFWLRNGLYTETLIIWLISRAFPS